MQTAVLNRLSANPLGRIAFETVSPLVRLARQLMHPGLPNHLAVRKLTYRDRTFSFLYRRWDPCDRLAARQCFTEAQYDLPGGAQGVSVQRLYDEIVASGRKPLILDCGANIGASVLWFAARYPHAHIVAIEPALENFNLLETNTRALDVDLRHAAIAATDGRAVLANPEGDAMTFRVDPDGQGEVVDLVSAASLLASKPAHLYVPFLMKIDIEGGEQSLFSGDVSALDQFPLIILEPHDWMLPGKLPSRDFFRFHVAAGREFSMKHENVASVSTQLHASTPTASSSLPFAVR